MVKPEIAKTRSLIKSSSIGSFAAKINKALRKTNIPFGLPSVHGTMSAHMTGNDAA